MKCPECVSAGQRSIVNEHGSMTTCMAIHTYYDEDGRRHYHDPNIHSTSYSCSNGHRWSEGRKVPCSSCEES